MLGLQCGPALAHSWYEQACCGGLDCFMVEEETLEDIGHGCWVYKPEGIRFCGGMVRPSQDSHWHVCYGKIAKTPYCVYIQQGS